MDKTPRLDLKYRIGQFPCKGCEERHAECHAHCEKYAEAKIANDKMREDIRLARQPDYLAEDARNRALMRRGKGYGGLR